MHQKQNCFDSRSIKLNLVFNYCFSFSHFIAFPRMKINNIANVNFKLNNPWKHGLLQSGPTEHLYLFHYFKANLPFYSALTIKAKILWSATADTNLLWKQKPNLLKQMRSGAGGICRANIISVIIEYGKQANVKNGTRVSCSK